MELLLLISKTSKQTGISVKLLCDSLGIDLFDFIVNLC